MTENKAVLSWLDENGKLMWSGFADDLLEGIKEELAKLEARLA